MNRAYSVVEIKEFNEDKREITGIATTIAPDRGGDTVQPDGALYKLPIPLLWMHDPTQPIGEVYEAKTTKKGIEIKARLVKISEPGRLADRLNEAWQSIKSGLVRGLSIGFNPIKYAFNDDGGVDFQSWEWLELSACVIPMNSQASIQTIKSLDTEIRAALGTKAIKETEKKPTGDTEKAKTVKLTPKEGKTMDISLQIKNFQAERVAKQAEMETIMSESAKTGETLNEEQAEKYDALQGEIEQIDKHLKRLEGLQKAQIASAKAVSEEDGKGSEKAAAARGPTVFARKHKEEAFQGQNYTRKIIAKALAYMEQENVSTILKQRWGHVDPHFVEVVTKANEVAAGGSGSGDWGAELVAADNRYTGDFIEYLYGQTVFFQLPLRQVPANVSIKGQDGAATANWVGENKAIPMSKPDFSTVSLTPLKVAAITALSNELIRDSSPDAEMLVRDALAEACAQKIDSTFFSTTAASAGVSPAGILNGIGSTTSYGPTADDVRDDIKTLYAPFLAAKNATGLVFVMTPSLAKSISLMVNALGQTEFPGLTASGGTLMGDRVYVGDNVTSGHLILLKPSDIWRIGMSGLQISISKEATIEQNSVPAGAGDTPAASANTPVSMFQTEQTAIKAVMPVNFQKRRTSAVAYVTGADYGALESGS